MKPTLPTRKKQRGAATLVVAVVLLIAISIIVLFNARTSIMEQRIAANDYRGKQAFEATEAAIEYAIGRANRETIFNLSDADNDGTVEFACEEGEMPADSLCDVPPLDNGAAATVSLTLPGSGNLTAIEVNASGISDDGTASRSVAVLIKLVPLLSNSPPAPLVTRGDADMHNSSAVINNIAAAPAIWSGGNATTHDATVVITGSVNDSPNSLSGKGTTEFFENFFQASVQQAKAQSRLITRTDTGGPDYSSMLSGANGQAIWIDARDGAGNPAAVVIDGISVGAIEPVILVIDGFSELTIMNGAQIHGLLYIAGAWDNGPNDADMIGSIIGEDGVTLRGNFTVTYNPGIIATLDKIGRYTKVAGSWRDF